MADLIDRQAAIKIAEGFGLNNGSALGRHSGVADMIAEALGYLPAIDAKSVRCENCVSSGGDRFGELICQNQLCPCYGREVDHAFSCIMGERRNENAAD